MLRSSNNRVMLLLLGVLLAAATCASATSAANCEAGRAGPNCDLCKPGFFSKGGPALTTTCQACPAAAMCRRMPMPCEQAPTCDSKTGRPVSMCWVKKPAGAACSTNWRSGRQMDGTCSSEGRCMLGGAPGQPKGPAGQGKPTSDIDLCKAGTGGASCAACAPGTYSLGVPRGKECDKCPEQPMCMRMPMPCEEMPACDPATGKATSMCWVAKPEGSACNTRLYAHADDTDDGLVYTCQAGRCLPQL